MQGPLRVVLVRRRHPEGRHHNISDGPLGRAARSLDLRPDRLVAAVNGDACPFGILIRHRLGRARQIREENRHQLEFGYRGGGEVRAAQAGVRASTIAPSPP